ncbi:MAG: porin family protein [Tannerellaceae bacterium]|nr:porin family protein [Tannerellaceae bacterium]
MTSAFFQRVVFILGLMAGSCWIAQAQEYKYEIGGMAGGAFYMGDVNKNTFFKGMNPALGGVFRYNMNFRWALKGNLTWGRVSGSTDGLKNVFPQDAQGSFSRDLVELGGQVEFNFFAYSDKYAFMNTKRFTPYVLLGMGVTVAPGNSQTFAGLNLPFGVGAKYKIKNRLNLGCEFGFRKLFSDRLDVTDDSNSFLDNPYEISSSLWKNKDWYSFLLLSVTWDFGPRSRPCNNINSLPGF